LTLETVVLKFHVTRKQDATVRSPGHCRRLRVSERARTVRWVQTKRIMGKKDPRVDDYIAGSADFARPVLTHLRKLVHAACPDVEEAMKWSLPHFMHQGILCSMAAFKNHCAFGFWKGSLIFGKAKTVGNTPKEAMGHLGRITAISDLPADAALIGYIKQAARLNEEGIKPPTRSKPRSKVKKDLVVPVELMAALKKNKKALAAFEDFSYSHKKEYVEWITEAKRDETRKQRVETAIAWMADGKSRHWKYMRA
jgi:uncharacterized protein YdeI (YjbR/CyaY-like superfamily)